MDITLGEVSPVKSVLYTNGEDGTAQRYTAIADVLWEDVLSENTKTALLGYANSLGERAMVGFESPESRAKDLVTPQVWQIVEGIVGDDNSIYLPERENDLIKIIQITLESFTAPIEPGNNLYRKSGLVSTNLTYLDTALLNSKLQDAGMEYRIKPKSVEEVDKDKQRAEELEIELSEYKRLRESGRRAYEYFEREGPFYGDLSEKKPTFTISAEPYALCKDIEQQFIELGKVLTKLRNVLPSLPEEFKEEFPGMSFNLDDFPFTVRLNTILDLSGKLKLMKNQYLYRLCPKYVLDEKGEFKLTAVEASLNDEPKGSNSVCFDPVVFK